jgi:hypothetical protein
MMAEENQDEDDSSNRDHYAANYCEEDDPGMMIMHTSPSSSSVSLSKAQADQDLSDHDHHAHFNNRTSRALNIDAAVDLDEILACRSSSNNSRIIVNEPMHSSPPHVIDARYMDDSLSMAALSGVAHEEECTDFVPNVFRKGFCMNCQKQHTVDVETGVVSLSRRFTRIDVHAVVPSKTAANAAVNPMALPENSILSMELFNSRRDMEAKQQQQLQQHAIQMWSHHLKGHLSEWQSLPRDMKGVDPTSVKSAPSLLPSPVDEWWV